MANINRSTATKRAEQVSRVYADGHGIEPAMFVAMALTDLMHYCDTHSLNYKAIHKRAERVYLSEKGEST